MINLFKKRQPKIRFFSVVPTANTLYPIIHAKDLKREWVAAEKTEHREKVKRCPFAVHDLRITKCPAITEYMSTGFILVAPADIKINVSDSGRVEPSYNKLFEWEYVQLHNPSHGDYLLDSGKEYTSPTVIKINTPWRAVVDTDIVFLQTKVHFNKESRFSPATGIFDPRVGYEMNVQLFWHVRKGEEIIKAGTPLCQYIPLSRSLLMSNDYSIDEMTQTEYQMELEHRYAQNSSLRETTSVSHRQLKTTKITDKYRNMR